MTAKSTGFTGAQLPLIHGFAPRARRAPVEIKIFSSTPSPRRVELDVFRIAEC